MMLLDIRAHQDLISSAHAVICTLATAHCEQHHVLINYHQDCWPPHQKSYLISYQTF